MREMFFDLATLATVAAPPGAMAASGEPVRAGTLQCDVGGSAGFIIGSKREVAYTYKAAGMKPQTYVGSIDRFGLDVGVTGGSVMVWQVVAPAADGKAMTYRGVSAGAAVEAGASANVPVSSSPGFNLQPVNVQGPRGIDLAAGVGAMTLRSAARG